MSGGRRLIHGLAAVAAAASITACADRSEMSSENRSSAGEMASTPAEPQQVRVTGCFQEMSGFDNFVLSNVVEASGTPASTRSYRIEQRGEYEQYVGKQVTVAGRVDSNDAPRTTSADDAKSGGADFNDLPELHVDSVSVVSENCGNPGQ